MAHIPRFGQARRPVLMTGAPQQAVTVAAPWQHGVRPSPIRPGVAFAVGFAQTTTPISRGTFPAPTEALPVATPVAPAISQPADVAVAQLAEVPVAQQVGVSVAQPAEVPVAQQVGVSVAQPAVEVIVAQPAGVQKPSVENIPDEGEETAMEVADFPAPELAGGQNTSGVHLEVVGSDAVVTVNATLLASPERDRESHSGGQYFLSTRFHRAPTPRMAYVPTPTRDDISKVDTQPQLAQPVPDIGQSHCTAERMADAVEMVMQGHSSARETGMKEAFLADFATLASWARQVLDSMEAQALDSIVKELEGVISFMRLGCPAAFTVCFEERGWPDVETIEMLQEWSTTAGFGVDSRVEVLFQELVRLHKQVYYTLRKAQANQVAAERAQEESAAKLASERAAWESERVAWQSERKALLAEKEQLVAEKVQAAADKEKEMGEVGAMM